MLGFWVIHCKSRSEQKSVRSLKAILAWTSLSCLTVLFLVAGSDYEASYNQSSLPKPTVKGLSFNLMKPLTADVEKPIDPQTRLLNAALDLSRREAVPYVYGGSALGSTKICKACRDCILAKNLVSDKSAKKRLKKCKACRSCGVDCSHFVSQIFRKAQLSYRFIDTSRLFSMSPEQLWLDLGLAIVSQNDLLKAEPGDLLVENGHIVLITGVSIGSETVDYVHATRDSRTRILGGIEFEKSVPIRRFDSSSFMILRHKDLLQPTKNEIKSWIETLKLSLLSLTSHQNKA
ncbi:MAG: hypothetical protein NT027_13580 [Proteobacteria bacterium]|nr:hypothetical protein [Pseudomonadota bacterium]